MKAWLLLLLCAPALAQGPGARLAASCAGCHGTQGHARGGVIAPLAGQPAEPLLAALLAYRDGRRAGTVMPQIARGYTPEELRLVAAYFAAQGRP